VKGVRGKKINPIRIPVTLSPHIVKGKPRGYYVLAQRLFTNGSPHLVRRQFVGFTDCLIITTAHEYKWDSLLKMAIHVPFIDDKPVTWLSAVPIYPIPMGFRAYIPGTVIKPTSAGQEKTETIGIFQRFQAGKIDLFYLEVPKLSAGVLLGEDDL